MRVDFYDPRRSIYGFKEAGKAIKSQQRYHIQRDIFIVRAER